MSRRTTGGYNWQKLTPKQWHAGWHSWKFSINSTGPVAPAGSDHGQRRVCGFAAWRRFGGRCSRRMFEGGMVKCFGRLKRLDSPFCSVLLAGNGGLVAGTCVHLVGGTYTIVTIVATVSIEKKPTSKEHRKTWQEYPAALPKKQFGCTKFFGNGQTWLLSCPERENNIVRLHCRVVAMEVAQVHESQMIRDEQLQVPWMGSTPLWDGTAM